MSTLCRVENFNPQLKGSQVVEFSRVPCIGEYIFTDDLVFEVNKVFHPMTDKRLPLIKVTAT